MNISNATQNLVRQGKQLISFGNDILQQTIKQSGSTFLGFALQSIAKQFTILAIAENTVLNRNINMKNLVPSNVVENGVDMSERIKREPFTITQTFTIGDFYIPKQRSTLLSAIPDVITKGAYILTNSDVLNAAQNAIVTTVLKNVFENKQIITLYTTIGVYENMVIESLNIKHTPGNTLYFDITLKEILIAPLKTTKIQGGNIRNALQLDIQSDRQELAYIVKDTAFQNINATQQRTDTIVFHKEFFKDTNYDYVSFLSGGK